MKKGQIIALIVFLPFTLFFITAKGQGWSQYRNAIYSVGIGGTDVVALNNAVYPTYYGGGTSINISAEYKVQRYIGVGFETGLDIFYGPRFYRFEQPYYPGYTAIGIPVGAKINFHLFDAVNSPRAGVGDAYIGVNLGGGAAYYTQPLPDVKRSFGFLFGGPQFGGRYWFNQNIGIFGEIGWGATFANVGLTF